MVLVGEPSQSIVLDEVLEYIGGHNDGTGDNKLDLGVRLAQSEVRHPSEEEGESPALATEASSTYSLEADPSHTGVEVPDGAHTDMLYVPPEGGGQIGSDSFSVLKIIQCHRPHAGCERKFGPSPQPM